MWCVFELMIGTGDSARIAFLWINESAEKLLFIYYFVSLIYIDLVMKTKTYNKTKKKKAYAKTKKNTYAKSSNLLVKNNVGQ